VKQPFISQIWPSLKLKTIFPSARPVGHTIRLRRMLRRDKSGLVIDGLMQYSGWLFAATRRHKNSCRSLSASYTFDDRWPASLKVSPIRSRVPAHPSQHLRILLTEPGYEEPCVVMKDGVWLATKRSCKKVSTLIPMYSRQEASYIAHVFRCSCMR
jgi:hypothetical protein